MGKALRAGVNPYVSIPELAAKFEPNLNQWLNVSAYPPVVALIGLPLSYLPYAWGVIVWLLFEIASLITAVVLSVKRFGGENARTAVLVVAFFFVGWQPIYVELTLGQLMIPILLLLTLVWLRLRLGKDVQAGLLLGVVMAIKLYAWPLAIFLLLSGRRKAFATSCAVLVIANVMMIAIVGMPVVTDYYLRVGGMVLAQYVSDPWNFSAWSIGFRALGTGGGAVLSVLILCYSLIMALRSKDFETGFMTMLIASTILQPISWIHYLITLLPAFCFVASRKNFSRREFVFVFILIALIIPGMHPHAHPYPVLATWPPFLFVIGFLWLTSARSAASTPVRQTIELEDKRDLATVQRVADQSPA